MELKNHDELYFIFSISLISYLKSKGVHEEKATISDESSKVVYHFKRSDRLFELINEYKDNKELQSFLKQLSKTKQEIFKLKD